MQQKRLERTELDLVCPTSMGVRMTPAGRQPFQAGGGFYLQATSAESNVLSIAAALGRRTRVLTKFVADSPIARLIQSDLRARGIEYEGPSVPQGGAWGFRHQFNLADSGYGMRGPRVWNDRAGEVGRTLCTGDFDLDRLFGQEGVRILHMSGLVAALSRETGQFCLELARRARAYGTRVSFDLNYRASFWAGREQELKEIFTGIASLSDVLIGNEEDFQLALGIPGPAVGGRDLAEQTERFQEMILRARRMYPDVGTFATTLRQVRNANEHLWGALLYDGDAWYVEEPRPIPVLDRIGGGDGFVGGMLYGMLCGWKPEQCLQFGWGAGAFAATLLTDYALPADEAQIWSIYAGNARVQR